MAISGVYQITSIIKPERVYIGSSIDIPRRWRSHKRKLGYDIHHASKLQNHTNKYGVEDLVFSIIEDGVLQEDLIDREQYWMDIIEPYFNSSLIAESGCQGYHHTKEMKKHLKDVQKGRKYALGLKRSEETKKRMSESKIGNQNALGSIRSEKSIVRYSESKMGFKNPNWSGKYKYPEGLTGYERKKYRQKLKRQLLKT